MRLHGVNAQPLFIRADLVDLEGIALVRPSHRWIIAARSAADLGGLCHDDHLAVSLEPITRPGAGWDEGAQQAAKDEETDDGWRQAWGGHRVIFTIELSLREAGMVDSDTLTGCFCWKERIGGAGAIWMSECQCVRAVASSFSLCGHFRKAVLWLHCIGAG